MWGTDGTLIKLFIWSGYPCEGIYLLPDVTETASHVIEHSHLNSYIPDSRSATKDFKVVCYFPCVAFIRIYIYVYRTRTVDFINKWVVHY